jgi:CGNR zinc finger
VPCLLSTTVTPGHSPPAAMKMARTRTDWASLACHSPTYFQEGATGDFRRALSVREALRAVLRADTPAAPAERRSASTQKGAVNASLLGTARAPSRSVMSSYNRVADAREAAAVLNAIAAYAPLSVHFHEDGQATLQPGIIAVCRDIGRATGEPDAANARLGTPRWPIRRENRCNGVEGALARLLAAVPLAQSDGSWRRLKICRNDACWRAFFEVSKNHSDAWCDLGKCGNRLNARASRAPPLGATGLTVPPGLR